MPDGGASAAWPKAPGQLAPLVRAIGVEAVLRLLEKRGGTVIYIPGHKLSPKRGIGRQLELDNDRCRELQKLLGNDRYKVPLCRQWRTLVYRSQGLTYTQIALKLGITENTVWSYLNARGLTNQLTLAV